MGRCRPGRGRSRREVVAGPSIDRPGACGLRAGWRGDTMSAASCNPRTLLMDLALRGSLTALGLLCVALLTATGASAQQSQSGDLSVVGSVGPNPVAAGA